MLTPAVWPAIVDRETVEQLRALLRDPKRRVNGNPRRYLLTGLARCGSCGARLVARPRDDKRRCYVCASGPGFAVARVGATGSVQAAGVTGSGSPDAVGALGAGSPDALGTVGSVHRRGTGREDLGRPVHVRAAARPRARLRRLRVTLRAR